MTRRSFLPAAASALAGAGANAQEGQQPAILEIGLAYLRNGADNERQRVADFWQHSVMPALQRAGAGPVGVFTTSIGPGSPNMITLTSYASLAAYGEVGAKLATDNEYVKRAAAFYSQPGRSFERAENSLLRAFRTMPAVAVPANDGKRPPKIFELRTYESDNFLTLRRKIKMFDDAEIAIFKRCGLLPIFFGQTIVGRNRPNLTYMVAYDDWASREKVWSKFGADPEWKKLRAQPELSDAAIVSNISNMLLTPLPFSPIR